MVPLPRNVLLVLMQETLVHVHKCWGLTNVSGARSHGVPSAGKRITVNLFFLDKDVKSWSFKGGKRRLLGER